ncbi:hypothetical protein [Hymenobacter convexus]|uniref:hypothetical protein n=1 Tax=Hymenobacter sp. CA1UV-4 TaxID=3063782 RepID=UPI002712C965|nr:hypothetical protein [Hymenobacter sp. CA1UV-4]MDO7853385.1 hypothetical protein [Hymenobacter sp. CA1UV-4]
MFIAFTAPLALLLLDILSTGISLRIYKSTRSATRNAAFTYGRLLLLTGVLQVVFVALLLGVDLNFRLSMRQNEMALYALLLSAFLIPPLLLWWKHRQYFNQS